MFNCLNGEITKAEAATPGILQTLQRAGAIVIFIVGYSLLSAALILLAIGGFVLNTEPIRKARRFSTT